MTQVQLAAALGVQQSVVSEIEAGAINVSAQRMATVARALGCQVQILLVPDEAT